MKPLTKLLNCQTCNSLQNHEYKMELRFKGIVSEAYECLKCHRVVRLYKERENSDYKCQT